MKNSLLFSLLSAALLWSCNNREERAHKEDILIVHRDTTVAPGDDFFEYANGAWVRKTQIPAEESQWGIGYLVNEELYKRKLKINEDALRENASNGPAQQIADFWAAGMDSVAIDRNGIKPLEAELKKIYEAPDKETLMQIAGQLHSIGVGVFFDQGVGQDAKNSEVMAYYLMQGGLGMPNRDYYLNNDSRTAGVREAYPAYVTQILQLGGVAHEGAARQKADSIMAFETALARSSRKLEDLRDPYANYNRMDMGKLSTTSPGINWDAVFRDIGLPRIDTLIVGQPEFLTTLSRLIRETPLQTLKDYMAFHLVSDFAPFLHTELANARFDFYGKKIRGTQEQRPRWKRVLDAEEMAIGEQVGKLFAEEYFNEKAKERYSQMVERVREAYKGRIQKLDWMSDSTKQKALAKLAAIKKKVGYPDKWKDFSDLNISRTSFAQNMMRAHAWWNKYHINKLGKPVDRDEWEMTPQTYNAYYNPSNNEIVLPAGIFTVPGYRDEELDDALVYGYAGASTIGHEITHGFDDEGRQFDAEGNLKNWWTPQDETEFKKRAQVLVDQFSKMHPLGDSMTINGKATLGENLADLGGILIGYDAFTQTPAFKEGKKISGLTPSQRFFLGYALGWLYKIRKEELASRLLTDVHAPAKERVNGPMPNVDAWYEAFQVQPGSKMYIAPEGRVRVW